MYYDQDEYDQAREEREFHVSSAAEVDQFEAHEAGYYRPDQCWILSGRDVWYRNPHYTGPVEPHPEEPGEDDYGPDDAVRPERRCGVCGKELLDGASWSETALRCFNCAQLTDTDDIPF